ncbi:MAG: hypothetical protein OXG78_05455 [Chloroflexi bacterium]|nr:hypothetical protein [Chloroflexota bacterium]
MSCHAVHAADGAKGIHQLSFIVRLYKGYAVVGPDDKIGTLDAVDGPNVTQGVGKIDRHIQMD